MSKFLSTVNAYQQVLSDLHDEDEKHLNGVVEFSYDQLAAVGLVKPASFRLPISLVVQLEQLFKFTPYSTKGEMVTVMLQDQIDAFLETFGDRVKESFHASVNESLKPVLGDESFSQYVAKRLTPRSLYEEVSSRKDGD